MRWGYDVQRSDLRKHQDLQSTVEQASDLRVFPNWGALDIRVLMASLSPRQPDRPNSTAVEPSTVDDQQRRPPSLRALAFICSALVLTSTLSSENAVIVCLFVLVGAALVWGAR